MSVYLITEMDFESKIPIVVDINIQILTCNPFAQGCDNYKDLCTQLLIDIHRFVSKIC